MKPWFSHKTEADWPEIEAGIHEVVKRQHGGALHRAFVHRNKAYEEAEGKAKLVSHAATLARWLHSGTREKSTFVFLH